MDHDKLASKLAQRIFEDFDFNPDEEEHINKAIKDVLDEFLIENREDSL
jgi:hypothetical protein